MVNERIVFSEVDGILNMLGKDYIELMPNKLYRMIEDNKEKNYIVTYNDEIPIYQQKISKEALAMICLIHYNYWCENPSEREKIKKVLNYNQEKHDKEIRERYNLNVNNEFSFEELNKQRNERQRALQTKEYHNLNNSNNMANINSFNNINDINQSKEENMNKNIPMEITKVPWYKKIIQKILKLFKRK